ncbi:MAG: glutathione S-transferase [Methylococcaceae bacterium]
MNTQLPVLYSFRRCPYAIRARLAIAYAGIAVEIREVELKNKPEQLLAISPKATVPVLQLQGGEVLDESMDIMKWALSQNDPKQWLAIGDNDQQLIFQNDGEFKYFLDRFKYVDRYPDYPAQHYREQAEVFLTELENRLQTFEFLSGKALTLTDAAIFPFIRQFAAVDNNWFQAANYPALNNWLNNLLTSELFNAIMTIYPAWTPGSVIFRCDSVK